MPVPKNTESIIGKKGLLKTSPESFFHATSRFSGASGLMSVLGS
jgi:hypothetical protein